MASRPDVTVFRVVTHSDLQGGGTFLSGTAKVLLGPGGTHPAVAAGSSGPVIYEIWRALSSNADRRLTGEPALGNHPPTLSLQPGATAFRLAILPAGLTSELHSTKTLDYHVVLAGEVDLVLEDGIHRLRTGDCAVVRGARHAWRSEHGATVAYTLISWSD
jgi:hypothetical protein